MGIPTPNIFTGAENYHGPFEFASLNDMNKAVETIVEIVRLNAEV
jgi:tripeptide aminopeptidase